MKSFDAAADLSDPAYKGDHNRTREHSQDLGYVMERARQYGVRKYIVPSCYLSHAKQCFAIALGSDDIYTTIGVHPGLAAHPFKIRKDKDEREALDEYFV